MEASFDTTLDRIKHLSRQMNRTVNRENGSVGEALIAADYCREDMIEKFKTLNGFEIPKKLMNDILDVIDAERDNVVATKLAAEVYLQTIVNETGELLDMPNYEVFEKDGKTVFKFVRD